ncbi:hypothetical protein CK203_086238 [Vitis vinifera]|uniref:Ubiquitin-like protease family profile domain-containing protein n=1 Tax=Vitis vinifera TaxID=29760 RepID=A0A438EDA2_VITVI|nr:hypothetical protein CK203_086238 [Vitis vinifera]
MDLKQAAALAFGEDLDASCLHFYDLRNQVVDAYCRLLQYEHELKTKLFLSPYIAEMVIHSQAKHLVREAVIGRFEPHVYQMDIPYVNVNEAKVILWLAAHKKEVSPYDLRTFNFLTPDVPLQPNEHDCGVFVMKFMELWSMGGFSKSIDVVCRRNYL